MPRSKATSTPDRIARPPFHQFEYTFIGGKGGVGKTTCAAAIGVLCARQGLETLVISTDPASSLGDVLGQPLAARPRAIRGAAHLHAVEVNAATALKDHLESRRPIFEEIALRGTWLDRGDVSRLLKLSLPGIDEVAALLQIAGLARGARYERIVVDSAPTGHMLRMLDTPAVLEAVAQVFDHMQSKHRAIVNALRGEWVPDQADAVIAEISRGAGELKALFRDRARAQMLWVTLPEMMSVEETADALRWLGAQGIVTDTILVNRVTPSPPEPCRWCDARRDAERKAIATLQPMIGRILRQIHVPAVPREPRGIRDITAVSTQLAAHREMAPARPAIAKGVARAVLPSVRVRAARVEALAPGTKLAMFGGKGGVGKTTCAAAAAVDAAIADAGRRVLLLSTDPAHSLGDALGQRFSDHPERIRGGPANLVVRELETARAFAGLRDRFASGIEELFARVSSGVLEASLARHDHQVMRDLMDLAPPGVDELVAIIEVMETLIGPSPSRTTRSGPSYTAASASAVRFDLVVIDTAPTGHALRLIEMPGLIHDWVKALMAILLKYQPVMGIGKVGALLLRLSQGLGRLREILRDSHGTRFVVVTRAAAVARVETGRLLVRLAAASISAPVVVVNAAGAGTCSRCQAERDAQAREITVLRRELSKGRGLPLLVIAPAELPPPHGAKRLARWRATWREVGDRA